MPRKPQLVGWLVMQKEDRRGRAIIEVHQHGQAIYLVRDDGEPHMVDIGRAIRWSDEPVQLWSCKASMVWNDLEICEGLFYPQSRGYPA